MSYRDERLDLIGEAVLAPSPHNAQPWRVELRDEDTVALFVDQERLLPQSDPMARQGHIAQGTWIEHFDIAARERGYEVECSYFPEGQYASDVVLERPVALLRLKRAATFEHDPLYEVLFQRTTNKSKYKSRAIPEDIASRLLEVASQPPVFAVYVAEEERRQRLSDFCRDAMAIEVESAQRCAELAEWFRLSNHEEARKRDGLRLSQVGLSGLERWVAESFLFDKEKLADPRSKFSRGAIDLAYRQASHTPAFLLMTTKANTRQDQVLTGRIYARLQLVATSLGVQTHPLSQVLEEYPEMGPLQRQFKHDFEVSETDTVQMLVRVGYAKAVPHTARRSAQSLLAS